MEPTPLLTGGRHSRADWEKAAADGSDSEMQALAQDELKRLKETIPVLEEQLKFLRDHGCHEVQGYLFCRPMPSDVLTKMIDTATPGAYTRKYARKVQVHAAPPEH